MDGTNNKVVRSANNAGGDSSTSASNRMVGSVAEEVAFTTAAAAGGGVARAGWSELHAFPGKVQDLGGTSLHVTSATLRWTTPSYDGGDGTTLQVGSTYYIRVASYTVPDTFSDFRLANISFSTNGVIPGELVSVDLLNLDSGTTYYARLWTTDGDSNIAYESNIASFSLAGALAPSGGSITSVNISSITGTWATSPGAVNYLLVGSTDQTFVPVAASSLTVASTGTISGLNPNTTYYLGVAACPGCSDLTPIGSTITLAAPAVALSSTGVSSSTINIAWGANGNPAGTRYVVRGSTDNVFFTSFATVTTSTAGFVNVFNDTTYYFFVIAYNAAGIPAAPSNLLVLHTPIGPVPYAPTGVTAAAVLLGVDLRWDAVVPGVGDGVGLLFYRVSRSTNAGFGFVSYATTTATSLLDRPLALGPTYYYKISVRDFGQTEGPFSATVGALPFTIAPMEPLAVRVTASPVDVTLSWSTTTRYGDGHLFLSTAAPLADELMGYSIWRSSDVCAPTYVNVSSLPITQTSTVSFTGGLNYFYRVHSYNSIGLSTTSVTLSTLGERSYFIDDCISRVVLDAASGETLNGSTNGLGDIRIDRRQIPTDIGEGVFQSVKFTPMLNGVTPLTNYPMPVPVRVVLGFKTAGGQPIATAQTAPGVTVKNLGMFWFNGAEFKKVYGTVDPVSQTVTVMSPNLGTYQIRALARVDGTVLDSSNISGRALTPNGDGLNDMIIFTYDPGPRNETVTGRIYDVMGSFVADMVPGRVPNTLTWDGRANGRVVGSGPYVYRIQGGGKSYSGTIVVAR